MTQSLLLNGICADDAEAARGQVWMYDHATIFDEVSRRVLQSDKQAPNDPLAHARDDNLDWPMTAGAWRAAKLARIIAHFDLHFTAEPSEHELVDLCLTAEAKAIDLLTRAEGNPRRKDGKQPFEGRTVVELTAYVLRRMFAEIELELAKKSPAERAAFALEFSQQLQALPDEVRERIRKQSGIADLSSQALMQTGAIAAVAGALAGTTGIAGFAAYTTLTSSIAAIAGIFGLHLSFHTFIIATSTLAFVSNPLVLGGALLLGGGLLNRRANRQIRDRLIPTMVATATIAGVHVDQTHDTADVVASYWNRARARTTADDRSRRRIDATFPCLPKVDG